MSRSKQKPVDLALAGWFDDIAGGNIPREDPEDIADKSQARVFAKTLYLQIAHLRRGIPVNGEPTEEQQSQWECIQYLCNWMVEEIVNQRFNDRLALGITVAHTAGGFSLLPTLASWEPLVQSAAELRKGGRLGGIARAKKMQVARGQVRAELQRLHEKTKTASYSAIVAQAARKFTKTPRQVRRDTNDLKW